MKFRLGVIVGFGTGYYLGAMAGRERYEQLNRYIGKIKRSDAFEEATEKAKAAVDLATERAKDVVDSKTNGGSPTVDLGNGQRLDKDDLQGSPTPY